MDFQDYLAIQNLIGRYGHNMDECSMARGDWRWMAEIFTEDAIFDLTPMGLPELVGIENIIASWTAGVHPAGHHVTNAVIEQTGPDSASCDTKAIIILGDGRCNTGYYKDKLVRTADGWRFKHRTCLIRAFDHAAGLPVFAHDAVA